MASINDVNTIRQEFTKVTGKLIEQFFKFDISRATEFQAGLVALKLHDQKFNAYAVRTEEELAGKLLDASINPLSGAIAEAFVNSENANGVLRDVPPLGEISVKLGMVDVKNKDLLMQAQAAFRCLDVSEAIESSCYGDKKPDLRGTLYDLKAEPNCGQEGVEPKFARNFIGFKSPKGLTSAQALNHLADVYSANYELLGVREVKPVELHNTLAGLRYLAVASLINVSAEFKQLGHDHISKKLDTVIEALSHRLWRTAGLDIEKEQKQEAFGRFEAGVSSAAKLLRGDLGVNKADLEQFISLRLGQVKGVILSNQVESPAALGA